MNEIRTPNAAKHAKIMEAAKAEFLENGFRDASMDRIAKGADVSKRTLYKYFESKETLFLAIIDQLWTRINANVDVRYQDDIDVRAQLTALGQAKGRILTDPQIMATSRLVVSEIIRSPHLAEETQTKMDYRCTFIDLMSAAAKDGKLKIEDPEEAADEFIGLLKSKAFWPVIFGAPVIEQPEMDRIVDNTVEMIMRRYG